MKRLILVASTLGLAVVLSLGLRAAPAATGAGHACTAAPVATDDPVPVDCPFCGGDAQLHARRMNDIAVTSARLAYSVLDAAIF
jgi:hypothetical protein